MSEAALPAGRWLAKKSARLAVGVGTSPIALLPGRGPLVRVLTYHRFGDAPRAPFTVSADDFERQVAHLAARADVLDLSGLSSFLRGADRPGDRPAVVVTIDDGDPSVLEVAAPILARHGVPAVAFVVAGRPDGYEVMPDDDLRRLPGLGVEVASHSNGHRSMARLPPEEAAVEAVESKRRLESVMGRPVTAFAYPFGTRADYSPAVAEVLREAGYELAFTSQHGTVRHGDDPLELPRVKVEGGDPRWLFPLLVRGALDAWRVVDTGLAGLQRPAAPGTGDPAPGS